MKFLNVSGNGETVDTQGPLTQSLLIVACLFIP